MNSWKSYDKKFSITDSKKKVSKHTKYGLVNFLLQILQQISNSFMYENLTEIFHVLSTVTNLFFKNIKYFSQATTV